MARVWRLRPHGEFDRVRQRGRSWSHPLLVLIALTRTDDSIKQARVSVAAGKKLGGAVIRNRVKRKMRAAIFEVYPHIPVMTDMIIIARQPILEAGVGEIQQAITATLQRAQLWLDQSETDR